MWEWLQRLVVPPAETSTPKGARAELPFATPEDARGELRPGVVERCIVYYGPGLAGKMTNMQWIHARVAPEDRGRMITCATKEDRTLFFRIYPAGVTLPGGKAIGVKVCTVAGPVFYDASRERVLRDAHGVIFVADSQIERAEANLESLDTMENTMEANGMLGQVPVVFQYNKRDLPNTMSVEQMDAELNPRGVPCLTAVARKGGGVSDTFKTCLRLVLEQG